jgi:hypothetical protein
LVDVTVANAGSTSPHTPYDQFGYDQRPSAPWLGLNGNSLAYLGPVNLFLEHGIAYDRSNRIELSAGERLEEGGHLTEGGEGLKADIEDGMIPVVTIEYANYPGCNWGGDCLPTGRAATAFVEGFVASAKEILARYPSDQILFEPMNEPYGYGTGAQYADTIAQLLPEAARAGIPLSDIYVAAYGRGWVTEMYGAQHSLETEIQGWYFHPYGPPSGTAYEDAEGIQSVPVVQREMTSGQNNIIVSEIGYWTPDVNGGASKGGPSNVWAANSAQAAEWLTEMLGNALPYHEAGWLRALVVYSRNDGGWAMEEAGARLTKEGEALLQFAALHGCPSGETVAPPAPQDACTPGVK